MQQLDTAAIILNIKRSAVIVIAMHRLVEMRGRLLRIYHTVEYQKKEPGQEWRQFHPCINVKEYAFFNDTRNLFKRSMSLLVAMAVEHLLHTIMQDDSIDIRELDTNNYALLDYTILNKTLKNVIRWITDWHIPPTHPG